MHIARKYVIGEGHRDIPLFSHSQKKALHRPSRGLGFRVPSGIDSDSMYGASERDAHRTFQLNGRLRASVSVCCAETIHWVVGRQNPPHCGEQALLAGLSPELPLTWLASAQ